MTSTLTIADAQWLSGRAGDLRPAPAPRSVWYFGDDYARYLALRNDLPADWAWGDTGGRLAEISEAHREALINLDNGFEIYSPDWWERRNIAERGPYASEFIADCCRYILFLELLNRDEPMLFIVERPDLAALLMQTAARSGIATRWVGPNPARRRLAALSQTVKDAARFARATLRRALRVARLAGKRRRRPVPVLELAACDVLIAAWTTSADFPNDRERRLAHSMGPLPELLREQGLNVGFIALPLDEIDTPDKIETAVLEAYDAAVLPDDTIRCSQVLSTAFKSLIDGAQPKRPFDVGGHDLSDLARMALGREKYDWRAVNAGLWANIGPYLARLGCQPKAVFHVYENHTWERGLRQGVKKSLPDTKVIGIHQSPFSWLYLNMVPSRREIETGRWPDAVLTFGEKTHRTFLEFVEPPAFAGNAGLLREGAFMAASDGRPRGKANKILCATGPGFQECLELTDKCARAISGLPGLSLIINFHPITTPEFRDGIRNFVTKTTAPDNEIIFTDQPIQDILRDGVDAVIYADTNAGFEGVSSGLKAVNVSSDICLSFDKLPDGLARRVRGVSEIHQALKDLDDDTKWPDAESVAETLADCFSPIDPGVILKAAGIGPLASGKLNSPEPVASEVSTL